MYNNVMDTYSLFRYCKYYVMYREVGKPEFKCLKCNFTERLVYCCLPLQFKFASINNVDEQNIKN